MKTGKNILLIDDDANLNRVLKQQLQDEGYHVTPATDGESGLQLFRTGSFDIVISDLAMPGINGMEVLRTVRDQDEAAIFILITAYGTVEDAVKACRLGADDFLTKPFGIEQLRFVIEKTLRLKQLEQENIALRTQVQAETGIENLIGKSPVMQAVFQKIRKVAPSDVTVLITGESGTGKELVARALHSLSLRRQGPFISVDSAAIPDNLMESELFGHVRGAFTGANADRKGKFELAHGGTLFLDEIGDLKPELQSKLLRVLQERQIEPLGSNRLIDVDVRILAATNQNLREAVKTGAFRQDLYYRLAVMEITLPPLRERIEDIPELIDFLIAKHAHSEHWFIEPDVYTALARRRWDGNIRELENVLQRAMVLSEDRILTLLDLGTDEKQTDLIPEREEKTLEAIEKRAIMEALKAENNNQTKAAKRLGIPRHVLIYRLKKWGISP
jgi:DNA-binding NtrC family response regulator